MSLNGTGCETWNYKIGRELKARLVAEARRRGTSIRNVVLSELGDEFNLPVELGRDRVQDEREGNEQLFLGRVPHVLGDALWRYGSARRLWPGAALAEILERRIPQEVAA